LGKRIIEQGALAVFHYLPLHKSPHFLKTEKSDDLANSERFSNTLIRLPMYGSITQKEIESVANSVLQFYK